MKMKLIELAVSIISMTSAALLPDQYQWLAVILLVIGVLILFWAAIDTIWPNFLSKIHGKVDDEVSLRRALLYATVRDWEYDWSSRADSLTKNIIDDGFKALEQFHQLARNGSIIVRGRPSDRAPHEEIPPEHWRGWHVEDIDVWEYLPQATPIKSTSIPLSSEAGVGYYDLVVNKRDVEKIWPKRTSKYLKWL